jgi:hypothetical protein
MHRERSRWEMRLLMVCYKKSNVRIRIWCLFMIDLKKVHPSTRLKLKVGG